MNHAQFFSTWFTNKETNVYTYKKWKCVSESILWYNAYTQTHTYTCMQQLTHSFIQLSYTNEPTKKNMQMFVNRRFEHVIESMIWFLCQTDTQSILTTCVVRVVRSLCCSLLCVLRDSFLYIIVIIFSFSRRLHFTFSSLGNSK